MIALSRLASAVALFVIPLATQAAFITVNLDSGLSGNHSIANASGVLLTGGTAADHDGDVIQLGYFSQSTTSQPFLGSFVPLTGEGSLNTAYNNTTIGDSAANGAGTGNFAIGPINFTLGSSTTGMSFPDGVNTVAHPQLAIRIYDGLSLASSTHFLTLSSTSNSWSWKDPADAPSNPVVNLSLDDTQSTLFLQNSAGTGAGTAVTFDANSNLRTNLAVVPEPSTLAFGGMAGLMALCVRRNRSARK